MFNVPTDFELFAEIYRVDSSGSGELEFMTSLPLDNIDWSLAREFAIWQRLQRRPQSPIVLDLPGETFAPSWDPYFGEPYINGIRIRGTRTKASDDPSQDDDVMLPVTFFRDFAENAVTQLVEAGRVGKGDRCIYRVCAQREKVRAAGVPSQPGPRETTSLTVDPVVESLVLKEKSVSDRLQRAVCADDQPEHGMPVFLPASVLAETHRQTRGAGAKETGGILIGHLCLDPVIPEYFLEITAQISAVHAVQEPTSLTLTPQTWAAVDAAVQLRGRGEQYLGWWHSHPTNQWCSECPEEKRRNCVLNCDFFSAQDIAVHRCCFSRAFQVALVVSDNGREDLSTAMYGWCEGAVKRRCFHVVEQE